MKRDPLVSVIIPTYNRSALLAEAIESVLGQTYKEIELVIADDGSTDDTEDRVAAFRYPKLRYLKLSHTGCQSVPRNRALDEVTGTYVAFLDDDDLWMPTKLERQIETLNRAPDAKFVYTDFRHLRPDGSSSPPLLMADQKHQGSIFTPLLMGCFVHPSTILARRDLVERVGGFDESLLSAEDYDWLLRLAHEGMAVLVDETLVLVRCHDGQVSRRRETITYESVISTLRRLGGQFELTWKQRLLIHRARARAHTKLGTRYVDAGEIASGRQHLRRAFLLNPFQRLWWRSLRRRLRVGDSPKEQ